MFQNKAKLVEYVVLLIALVALGFSIASILKPCKKSDFADTCQDAAGLPDGKHCPLAGKKCGVGHYYHNCGDMLNCVCQPDTSLTSCKGEIGSFCNSTDQGMQCCSKDPYGRDLICKPSDPWGEGECQLAEQPPPGPDPSRDYQCDGQQNALNCNSQPTCYWNSDFNTCVKQER